MNESFKNPNPYDGGDFEGHASSKSEEVKSGTKSHKQIMADALEFARKDNDKILEENVKSKIVEDYLGKPETGKETAEDRLSFDQFKDWLEENGLAEKISLIEEQINDQEKFHLDAGGGRFNRSNFFIEKYRLPGIKKGFETGCLNFAMPMPVAENLTEKEKQMNEALYVYHKLAEPLESKKGFNLWDKVGKERWTKQDLLEHLGSCNPVEPNEIDAEAFKKDWVAEEIRVLDQKGAPAKIKAGSMRLVFTDNRLDVPKDQAIVNKKGEVAAPKNNSHIETVTNNIRVLSRAEKIALASYVFWKTGKYLSPETWEFERDFVDHRDKKTNPPVSVAHSHSDDVRLKLYSDDADGSSGGHRRRVSL